MLVTTLLLASVLVSRPPAVDLGPGSLITRGPDGGDVVCPLKLTDVHADIAGLGARVTVVQTFTNPLSKPIEAVYTFPLPADAAVDRMRMKVGDRIVLGKIMKREEAAKVYEKAKNQGKVAALLDQERPNIFTQSVANIMPGATVEVEISYVQMLKYEDGEIEFMYPMVVGPRFMPASTPDPGKIAPPIVAKGKRTGTDVKVNVQIDAGATIASVRSVLHDVTVKQPEPNLAEVNLRKKDEIPNRDFILRYRLKGGGVQEAFLTHADPVNGGSFSLVLLPPKTPRAAEVRPREVIFVMDQSGSQTGFPLQKSKELTKKLLKTLGPNDTFNVISFSNGITSMWPNFRPAEEENLDEATKWVDALQANGGTQLLPAVIKALYGKPDGNRIRLVVFNTDGFVGNDFEILSAVRKFKQSARMFTFGIGNGVNRFLIDGMSAEGRGDSEIVTLQEAADAAVERFVQRTSKPILTDIKVECVGGGVLDMTPTEIPDVFSEKPVIVFGRYTKAGHARIRVSGMVGTERWSRNIDVDLPAQGNSDSSVGSLWARHKIDDLMRQNWEAGISGGRVDAPEMVAQLTSLALKYNLMSQYTSFVAVEEKVVNRNGVQESVQVPVEMTDGVSYEGIFGNVAGKPASMATASLGVVAAAPAMSYGSSGGVGGGGFGGGRAAGGVLGTAKLAKRVSISTGRNSEELSGKVAPQLQKAKGTVKIQVYVNAVTPELVKALKELGLKIESSDKTLKVVFGKCDVKVLAKLAKHKDVVTIESL